MATPHARGALDDGVITHIQARSGRPAALGDHLLARQRRRQVDEEKPKQKAAKDIRGIASHAVW
jgi:hypothetical protein